jgi:hypothetical protein
MEEETQGMEDNELAVRYALKKRLRIVAGIDKEKVQGLTVEQEAAICREAEQVARRLMLRQVGAL